MGTIALSALAHARVRVLHGGCDLQVTNVLHMQRFKQILPLATKIT